jgi:hypothetical protein
MFIFGTSCRVQEEPTSQSHVFTRIKESHNQYLVQAKLADAAGLKLKPHSAKDTLDFLKKHIVKKAVISSSSSGWTFFVTQRPRGSAFMSSATHSVPS